MTRKETYEVASQTLDIYCGILFHNQEFGCEDNGEVIYEFDCPEFEELRKKYELVKIAGKGSDFVRAKRLLHYLAPRLTHSSYYDNHIENNALRLLEYSLNNPEQGINCSSKSKILVECCLALGIFARRVVIMPFSPYDFDNHVVAEIYDRTLYKWIMLDPTTDGYFIDEDKNPLSLLEMRNRFANAEFITFVKAKDSMADIHKLREKYIEINSYICKNLFYFSIEKYSTFGAKGEYLDFIPTNFSVKKAEAATLKFKLNHIPKEYEELRPLLEEELQKAKQRPEAIRTDMQSMLKKPL